MLVWCKNTISGCNRAPCIFQRDELSLPLNVLDFRSVFVICMHPVSYLLILISTHLLQKKKILRFILLCFYTCLEGLQADLFTPKTCWANPFWRTTTLWYPTSASSSYFLTHAHFGQVIRSRGMMQYDLPSVSICANRVSARKSKIIPIKHKLAFTTSFSSVERSFHIMNYIIQCTQ